MANKDIPRGFSPMGETSGSDYIGKTSAYAIAAADTNAYGIGDLVKRTGAMVEIDGTPYPVVDIITSGTATALEGAIVGFDVDPVGFTTFRTAGAKSDDRIVFLPDAPYIEYEAQVAAGGTVVDGDAGLNADIAISTPDTATGQSTMQIADTDPTNVATRPLRLVRRSYSTTSESGEFATWVVRLNTSSTSNTTGI